MSGARGVNRRRLLLRPVRMLWRRLTSMRTALILLFLLAVAAVPGSLLPQRPLNPGKVRNYIADHGSWGSFLDDIGMFDVFGSVWFAAVYLLLFVSLVGCLIPRIRVHARAVVRTPLAAPRHLDRLPESGRFERAESPEAYAQTARATLGRRWRVAQRREDSGAITLSAEKGYTRETGNLIFHVALLVTLVLIAIGRLYTYEGTRIVREGTGFCNTISQYDEWRPGRFAAEGKVGPAHFCIDKLTKFTATYTADGEARTFAARIAYRTSLDAPLQRTTITVNHPLRLEGDRVYLISHGYSPQITVRSPDGTVEHRTAEFLPTNPSTYYSEGVFSIPGPTGKKRDIGIRGFFAPTPVDQGGGVFASSSPAAHNPVLGVQVYGGDLNETGLPRSVFTIDTSKMSLLGTANLRAGQTKTLSDGTKVTFDGWVTWASLQVSHDPAQGYLLFSALAMVVGLGASLGVRRRRLWLRIAPAADGPGTANTLISVGGLARSDSGNFTTEFATLLERLSAAAPVDEAGPEQLQPAPDDVIGAGKE